MFYLAMMVVAAQFLKMSAENNIDGFVDGVELKVDKMLNEPKV
jgi:hypothetical protein